MRSGPSLLVLFALAALPCLVPPDAWAQCAMCQTALTGSPEGRSLTEHLNRAILVMFAAPYLVVASFLLLAFRGRIGRALAPLAARLRFPLAAGVSHRPRPQRVP